MSELKTILIKEAQTLRSSSPELVAVEMLKKAGFSEEEALSAVAKELIEKEATEALSGRGFDPEEAVKLVKAANVDLAAISATAGEITEITKTASLLEKAASELEALEAQIVALQGEVEHVKQASEDALRPIPEPINRLAVSGSFTNEDLDALMNLPETTLHKVAAAAEEPWAMGKAAGAATGGYGDPLTDFLMR